MGRCNSVSWHSDAAKAENGTAFFRRHCEEKKRAHSGPAKEWCLKVKSTNVAMNCRSQMEGRAFLASGSSLARSYCCLGFQELPDWAWMIQCWASSPPIR